MSLKLGANTRALAAKAAFHQHDRKFAPNVSSLISRSREEPKELHVNDKSVGILYVQFKWPPDDSLLNEWTLTLIPPYVQQSQSNEVLCVDPDSRWFSGH